MDYFDTVIPVLLSFSISVILCPIVIPFLKWLKFGQYVRDDGPKSHLKKAGTPTMGGLIILISVVVTSSLYLRDYPEILPVIFATVGFGLIGFLDDYIKIVMRRSLGLRAWQKLVLQLLVTIIFVYYYTQHLHYEMHPEDILLCRDGCLFRFYFLSWWELSTAQILRTDWMGLHPA